VIAPALADVERLDDVGMVELGGGFPFLGKLSDESAFSSVSTRKGKPPPKLNHPNIVQAFDVGEAGGYHYFVMEYVPGHTLHDELAGGKVFTEAEAMM